MRQLDAIVADRSKLHAVLFPSSSETAVDDDVWIDVGNDWEALDAALVAVNPSLTFISRGGKELGKIGDRQARGFASDETRRVAAALSLLTPDRVPEALAPTFQTLKLFITETAVAAAGVIVFWR